MRGLVYNHYIICSSAVARSPLIDTSDNKFARGLDLYAYAINTLQHWGIQVKMRSDEGKVFTANSLFTMLEELDKQNLDRAFDCPNVRLGWESCVWKIFGRFLELFQEIVKEIAENGEYTPIISK